jgi:hypothetical protein
MGWTARITITLSAFMNIMKCLNAHYAGVSDLPLHDPSYPYPTSYDDKDGWQINFRYECWVDEKLVFIVMTDTNEWVVMKFMR